MYMYKIMSPQDNISFMDIHTFITCAKSLWFETFIDHSIVYLL